MSWMIPTVGPVHAQDIGAEMFKNAQAQQGYGEEESQIAIGLATAKAVEIAVSGRLGKGPFSVSANGHSNPSNTPQDGWAKDFMTITVTAL